MDDDYRNRELLDIADEYGLDTNVEEHIPYPDRSVHISGLHVMSTDTEGHIYPLDADDSRFETGAQPRMGYVIDDRNALGACHAGQHYLDDLADVGYDGRTFTTADAFRDYVDDTASSGLFWPQLFPAIEPRVVDDGEQLDDAIQDVLDDHEYTSFTSHGTPEHAVETLAELVTTPYDRRETLHDDTHHVDVPAETAIADLLAEH